MGLLLAGLGLLFLASRSRSAPQGSAAIEVRQREDIGGVQAQQIRNEVASRAQLDQGVVRRRR